VFGGGAMNVGNVMKWCRLFEEGRTNAHDDKRIGCLSLVLLWKKKAKEKNSGKRTIQNYSTSRNFCPARAWRV